MALEVRAAHLLPAEDEKERELLNLARKTLAPDATDAEFSMWVYDCRRRGVHPLDKLIHFTKRGGRYVPITSIDYMRSRADATGLYAGSDAPVLEGTGKYPDKATVTVYKIVAGIRCPFTRSALWTEYYPGDGPQGQMWRKMPEVMLSKCAEGQALRVAFPQQLEGLYNNEEMDQAAPKAARVEVQQIAMPRPVDPEPEEEPQPPIPPDPDDDFILRDVGITAVQPKVAQKSGSKYWEIVTVDGEILLTNSQAVASRADDAARTFAICDLVYEKAGNRNVLTDVRILSGEEAPIG